MEVKVNFLDKLRLEAKFDDFTVIEVSPRDTVRRISNSTIAFDQLILEFDRWVHLSVTCDTPRRQVLTLRKGSGYLPGLQ